VIVHDLSPEAVSDMIRVDLANATEEPPSPIGYFDFHGCLCGIGSFVGCWHSNDAPTGVTMLFMTPRDGNSPSWDDPAGQVG
jgi:hypothetical protein